MCTSNSKSDDSPLFHYAYDFLTAPLELFLRPLRKDLVQGLSGEGVELSSGSGSNFAFYAPGTVVNATEPDSVLLEKAKIKKSQSSGCRADIRLAEAPAEDISHIENNSQDFAVATLAFCTIEEIAESLEEMRRVLKPSGQMYLLEHVKSKTPWLQSGFEFVHQPWKSAFGGCRLGQDTQAIFRQFGFDVANEQYHNSFVVSFTARPR